jgi:hypothetical protein
MKKLNLATTAAVATVMSASGAYADLSLGGAVAQTFASGDGVSGWTSYGSSYTINIDYTTTLDNGMGLAANVDLNPDDLGTSGTLMTFSTGAGSVYFGTDFHSAMDDFDYTQGAGNWRNGGRLMAGTTTGYNDGDAASGDGIGLSTSVAGASVKVTLGETTDSTSVMSIGASMDFMGATIKAGNTDFDTTGTDDVGFVSVGYSVGGFNLGWNHYDMGDDSMTHIGASTSVAGLGVGISSADYEDNNSQDHDAMGIHITGDLGGAWWAIDYINEDDGNSNETDSYALVIGTGF